MEKIEQIQNQISDTIIFGSFFLTDSEFAISATYVQEVVNAPATYTAVPLAPNYLKGLFNLRGTVIPVLDLRELLNLKNTNTTETQKVAIIELSGACVGLLFDKTGEVFRNNEDERSDFENTNLNAIISGVFKKDSGKRIVQILDVTKLFKLQNIPKDSSRSKQNRERLANKRGLRRQCISFVVGPAKCSLPISEIQEIIKVDCVNELSLSSEDCIGAIDLRGITVPVIDFASLLKYRMVDRSAEATLGDRRIIVMKLEKELFGLMVDSVDSIISFFPDELIAFPLVEQNKAEMFLGCITGHADSDILLLDHQKIFTNAEVNEITNGHSKIFQTKGNSKENLNKSKGGARRTYITFKIDCTYAIAINELKEIIDFPKQLLQPPGMKKHVLGVLNLRGDLVTIIDSRSMYLNNAKSTITDPVKILVFKKNNMHFGLVVDSVESIVTFADNDKVKLPEILYKKEEDSMSTDVSEAVEVIDSNGLKRSMLILAVDTLVERATKSIAA